MNSTYALTYARPAGKSFDLNVLADIAAPNCSRRRSSRTPMSNRRTGSTEPTRMASSAAGIAGQFLRLRAQLAYGERLVEGGLNLALVLLLHPNHLRSAYTESRQ